MRKRIFFICGSMNQTTQMHQISKHLADYELSFSPFYCHGFDEILRRLGLVEFTIAGNRMAERCRAYLQRHSLPIDYQGKNGPYDLVVTCTDVYLQNNIRDNRIVLVQEGIIDPDSFMYQLVNRLRFLPRWMADTAMTGLSDAYQAFCVASEGYRDFFIQRGARPEKIVVTGIPNFDNCHQYCTNDFPHHHHVLACTSNLREVGRREDRAAFIRRAVEIAGDRQLIFKLHPNENIERATREINEYAPGAMVFATGSAEEMIANCDALITRFSSTAFVGVALGKDTYSDFDMDTLRRLMPLQNESAALNIANVCRRVLAEK
ncbi:MAG: glycosyltransferase family protein [Desulfobulbaceae bacterium]